MNIFAPFVVIGLFFNNVVYAYDVVDYLTRFFERYDHSKIVYFVIECDSSSIENAVDVVKILNSKSPREKMNVITTTYSQHAGTTATTFTSTLRQLEETLERYACNSSLTYNNEPPKPETYSSILLSIVDQMHYNETIFFFTGSERSNFWPEELQRKLEEKNIQINVVVTDSSRASDSFLNTVRNIGGRIFPYRVSNRKGSSNSYLALSSFGYTYKLEVIEKENLVENARVSFRLPDETTNIILVVQGISIQKALLISPSGIMMNLLPTHGKTTRFEPSSTMAAFIINFRLPIYESPAEWTLSSSGIKYNASMTMMIKTKSGLNGQMHSTDGVYDVANSNQNSFSTYRSYSKPNEDQWTSNSQSNYVKPNEDQWTRNSQSNYLKPYEDQWSGTSYPNSAFMKRNDNERQLDKDQWIGNSQFNSAQAKRYENDGMSDSNQKPGNMQPNSALMKRYDNEGPSSSYDIERSNKLRLTDNLQQNAGFRERYDNDGFSTYNAQNPDRLGIQPPNSFNEPTANSISTTIDVDVVSTFYVYPGEEARVVFNVRNNKQVSSKYIFNCHYMHQPCTVYPIYASLLPQEHVQVIVTVRASGSDGSSSIVGLISMSESIIDKKVYLFIGRPRSDRKKPDIDYEYNGNCDDASTGNTCLRKRWSANVVAQDTESGLLNFWSEPRGLIYTSEFIVGTKEDVPSRYTASCCNPKVDILASDLQGNTYRITLNVEHQYLSVVEITAIILGVVILILLVLGIVFGIVKWRRRNRDTSFLKRSPTQRYNADQ